MASNQEEAIKSAAANGDAGDVSVAYAAYVSSMENAGQTPKSLNAILGK